MKRVIAFALCLTIGGLPALAQQPAPPLSSGSTQAAASPAPQRQVRSPEILTDGRVTFRLFAPNAAAVSVNGNWPNAVHPERAAMTKGADGVWSVTLGPIKPEYWFYTFTVDGATMLDPSNFFAERDGRHYLSTLTVPGAGSDPLAVHAVPHGTLAYVWYDSPALHMQRRALVYTPPGYETGTRRYPVFYLLHGGGGDENSWNDSGHASQIFDNLIASGHARPMIVVMSNGNAWQGAAPNYQESPADVVPTVAVAAAAGAPSPLTATITQFPDSLRTDLIPFIDKTYRTRPDKADRAIAGLSMGGAQSFYAALNNLDEYSYLGSFSGGFPLLPGVRVDIPLPANADELRGPDINHSIDPAKLLALVPRIGEANQALKLFYFAIGGNDALTSTHAEVKKMLDRQGVRYVEVVRPGYVHEWPFWSLSLADFMPRLFQTASN